MEQKQRLSFLGAEVSVPAQIEPPCDPVRRTQASCDHETQSNSSGWVTCLYLHREVCWPPGGPMKDPSMIQHAMNASRQPRFSVCTPYEIDCPHRSQQPRRPAQPRAVASGRCWYGGQAARFGAAHTRLLGPVALRCPRAPCSCAALWGIYQSRAWHGRICCPTPGLSGCICHTTANEANCHLIHLRRSFWKARGIASHPGASGSWTVLWVAASSQVAVHCRTRCGLVLRRRFRGPGCHRRRCRHSGSCK
ncbi:hypothetical protein N658DRAFT_63890 [Parathielavia hyrcaniae]|uniref:Uncharacterized protein n=1 Tax=Parathielavia hyrcaniae TaxID=113614 RepID=A0AAN6T1D8_9PEZI|nr:hypothetical protein N658DRAFT_63890 [Parathielavia hyrcaniae]